MAVDPATELRERLRRDLRAAMGDRRSREIAVLRELIGAVDNAQAPPAGDRHERYAVHAFGDRSAEVPRVPLDASQLRVLLEREIEIRRRAAAEFDRLGRSIEAAGLREEAEIAGRYFPAGRD